MRCLRPLIEGTAVPGLSIEHGEITTALREGQLVPSGERVGWGPCVRVGTVDTVAPGLGSGGLLRGDPMMVVVAESIRVRTTMGRQREPLVRLPHPCSIMDGAA